jgi:hypothetical protein
MDVLYQRADCLQHEHSHHSGSYHDFLNYFCSVFYFCAETTFLFYKSPYNMLTISYLNSPLSPFSIISAPPIPGLLYRSHFSIYIDFTQYLHHIHHHTPFPNSSLFPLLPVPQGGPVLSSCFPIFLRKK